MTRLCSFCRNEIKVDTAIFCYYCGEVLEEKEATSKNFQAEEKHTRKRLAKSKIAYAIILPTLLAVFGISFYQLRIAQKSKPSRTAEISEVAVLEKPKLQSKELENFKPASTFEFGQSKFEMLTPIDADYYFEATNLPLFVKNDQEDNPVQTLITIFDLTEEETLSYFESDFGYFCQNNSCGLLLLAKNSDAVKQKLQKAKVTDDPISATIFDKYLLLYKNEDTKAAVLEVSEKLTKSLGMDSKFLAIFKDMPNSGLFFGYLSNPSSFNEKLDTTNIISLDDLSLDTIPESKIFFYAKEDQGKSFVFY